MERKTFIGVLFRNNKELVAPFFFFLYKSLTKEYHVIAIDNGSKDNTVAEIIGNMEPKATLHQMDRNIGISKGRNRIIEIAKEKNGGKYPNIVLLDSDCFISRIESIESMVAMLLQINCGIVCGKTTSFYLHGERIIENYGASFCIINGRMFDELGLFDEQFELYYDDSDFFKRVINSKNRIVKCAEATAVHLWGQTLTVGSEMNRREKTIKSDEAKFKEKWRAK